MSENKFLSYACPRCGSTYVLTERRIDGNTTCLACHYTAPTCTFDKNDMRYSKQNWEKAFQAQIIIGAQLERRIAELERENADLKASRADLAFLVRQVGFRIERNRGNEEFWRMWLEQAKKAVADVSPSKRWEDDP
jgi:uncharacterized Zn finger protein (UPF0148 family)